MAPPDPRACLLSPQSPQSPQSPAGHDVVVFEDAPEDALDGLARMPGVVEGDVGCHSERTRRASLVPGAIMPAHMLRGVPLSRLLARWGAAVRRRPDSLKLEERGALHALSQPVEQLAFFLSHCWSSPGYQKYLTILVHFMGPAALLVGALAAFAVHCAQRLRGPLPTLTGFHDDFFDLQVKVSGWEYLAGMATGWCVLLLGHALQPRSRNCFLDCACIHQTDPELKLRAIRHLAGFLRKSRELVIMWDDLYLSRGWCAFELASFLALDPTAKVTVLPIGIYTTMLLLHGYHAVSFGFFLVLWPYIPGVWGCCACIFLASMPMYTLGAGVAEDLVHFQRTLVKQVTHFHVEDTETQEQADRDHILTSIRAMVDGGIDGFNTAVRTQVKGALLGHFAVQRAPISYSLALLTCCPAVPFYLSLMSSFGAAPGLFQLVYAVFVLAYVLCCFPSACALLMLLGGRGAPEKARTTLWPTWRHVKAGSLASAGLTTAIWSCYIVPCGLAVGAWPVQVVPLWGLALVCVEALGLLLVAVWLFRPGGAPEGWRSAEVPALAKTRAEQEALLVIDL